MGSVGESSVSNSLSDEIWAKLVPTDSRCSDVEIKMLDDNEMFVNSVISTSSSQLHQWCKLLRNSDSESATLLNHSPVGILVDGAVIENGESAVIKCGSEIVPAPHSHGYLSYRFKLMPKPESSRKQLKICIDADHAKCSICLSVWHDVVTLAPCFHNFCNGCFSEWLRRSQDKHSTVLCPQCRAVVQFAGRNHFLHNIGEEILKADSSLRRSNEEVATLDSSASIQSNLVVKTGKRLRRKRAYSSLDEESQSADLPCPQCGSDFGGFRCSQDTIHLQCQACGGMMPSRSANTSVPQHCLGCERAFCGAYWHAQGITGTDSHATCSRESFKPVSERTITRIPFWAHEKNRHEQDITENCIRQMGRTLQDVVAEWITKLNNREIVDLIWHNVAADRTRMPLNHAEMITGGTHLCNDCYEKLVSFLLYWYRISIPKYLLPAEREDCWYGYACRTQHHNEQHARRRDHVCRPTRTTTTATPPSSNT